jgi:hypothetical protein
MPLRNLGCCDIEALEGAETRESRVADTINFLQAAHFLRVGPFDHANQLVEQYISVDCCRLKYIISRAR